MTIQKIFDLALQMGKNSDLRGKARVSQLLKRENDKYEKLSGDKKKEFDKDKLSNPFSDTRIMIDKPNQIVKKVMVGIDITLAEFFLAKQMGDIDLIIAHHPQGKGLADLSDVMESQIEVLHKYGVPINVAQNLVNERISEVARGVHAANHYKTIDSAQYLNIGFINVHTPADNLAAKYLFDLFNKKKCEYVDDVIKELKEIPEYQEAIKLGFGPKLFAGKESNFTGKIAVTEITGGTEGSKDIYEKMANAGIGTILAMHQSEEHRHNAQKAHINVVIAGHMSSDSLGMNLYIDELEKKGIQVVPVSGFMRNSRNKKAKPATKKTKKKK